ncbi:MAG: hypothetical protein ACFE9Z_12525 [Promethearchaeota archaeon]
MNEVFYEIKDIKNQATESQIGKEIVLHFLAKVSETLILYETKKKLINSKSSNTVKEQIQSLEQTFREIDPSLNLIKGKIREIYISYSS